MGKGKIILVVLGTMVIGMVIGGVIFFSLVIPYSEKTIVKKVSSSLGSEQTNIQTLIEEIKKLKENTVTKDEYNKLKEENLQLQKKVEISEKALQELTTEVIMKGIETRLTAKKQESKKPSVGVEGKGFEEIMKELTKAIEAKDVSRSFELWKKLLALGPDYFPQALEMYGKMEKELLKIELGAGELQTKDILKEVNKFLPEVLKLGSNDNFIKLGEWIVDARERLTNGGAESAVSNFALQYPEKALKVYDYLKEKLKEANTQEEETRYKRQLALLITQNNEEVKKRVVDDLANPVIDINTKRALARSLGKSEAIKIRGNEQSKEGIEEEFKKAIENQQGKEELEKEFEEGKKEVQASLPPIRMNMSLPSFIRDKEK